MGDDCRLSRERLIHFFNAVVNVRVALKEASAGISTGQVDTSTSNNAVDEPNRVSRHFTCPTLGKSTGCSQKSFYVLVKIHRTL